ncbi:hypothetical protein C8R43DRAFT_1137092 [Mycena crocata]|nr:hypothetical protein C8R43DRAFT_1137092 [Mycena crocata]
MPARGPPAVRQYIDDRAQDTDADMSDDDERADPDSAEGLIQALDAQDFDMAGLQVGHEARLRADAPYRMPHQFLGAATPSHIPQDDNASMYGSRPTSPMPNPTSAPLWSDFGHATPARIPDDGNAYPSRATSPLAGTQFLLPAARERAVPAVPPYSAAAGPSSTSPLFLPGSRDPTPFIAREPREWTPWVAPQYVPGEKFKAPAAPSTTSSEEEPIPVAVEQAKRKRAESDSGEQGTEDEGDEQEEEDDEDLALFRGNLTHPACFLDVAAEDSDSDGGSEAEDSEDSEDLGFIDDAEQDDVAPPPFINLVPPIPTAQDESDDSDDPDPETMAARYERLGGGYAAAAHAEEGSSLPLEQHTDETEAQKEEREERERVERKRKFMVWRRRRPYPYHKPAIYQEIADTDKTLMRRPTPPPIDPTVDLPRPPEFTSTVKQGDWIAHRRGLAWVVTPDVLLFAPSPNQKEKKKKNKKRSKKFKSHEFVSDQDDEDEETHKPWSPYAPMQQPVASAPPPQKKLLADAPPNLRLLKQPLIRTKYPPLCPTIDQLLPFHRIRLHPAFLDVPYEFEGTDTALAEGDLVVVKKDELPRWTGMILMMRDVKERGRLVLVSRRTVFSIEDTPEAMSPAQMIKRKGRVVTYHELVRHPLDPSPDLQIGDRVKVIAGQKYRGIVGRVVLLSRRVSVRYSAKKDYDIIDVPYDHLHRLFRLSDEVEIVRGELVVDVDGLREPVPALVVGLFWGGSVLDVLVNKPLKEAKEVRELGTFRSKNQQLVRVRSKDVRLKLRGETRYVASSSNMTTDADAQTLMKLPQDTDTDKDGKKGMRRAQKRATCRSRVAAALLAQGMTPADLDKLIEAALDKDERRQQQHRDRVNGLMYTGTPWRNREILIVRGDCRGQHAVVVDYHDTAERRTQQAEALANVHSRSEVPDLDGAGIMLTVHPDMSNTRFQVKIEDCVDRLTLVPLVRAAAIDPELLAAYATYRDPPAPPPPPRFATPPPPPGAQSEELWTGPPEPSLSVPWATELATEDNSNWLCIAGLVGKRVEVRITGLKTPTAKKLQTAARYYDLEGRVGDVLPEFAITKGSLSSQKVHVYLTDKWATLAAMCLKPIRESPHGRSLCTYKERVVIIGPNIDGDHVGLGQYAQTMPNVWHGKGPDVVQVQFALGVELPYPLFHLSSLCRSTNLERAVGNRTIPVTEFEDQNV